MGFFKKEKAVEGKLLTDYFTQREAKELFDYALKIISPQIFMGGIYVDTSARATDGCFKDDKYKPIPKVCKKERIDVVTLLEISCAKGYGVAAFLLGMIYEHGIGCYKNEQTAESWYSKAIDLSAVEDGYKSKAFAIALAKVRNSGFDFSAVTAESRVGYAITMTSLRMRTGDLYETVVEELGNNSEWLDEFVELGYFILCHYATKKEVASMCELGVCMFQCNLIENLAVKRAFFLESEEKIMKTGEKILNCCIALARNGDVKAQYYVKNILGMKI